MAQDGTPLPPPLFRGQIRSHRGPKLLVSVRNAEEAECALAGGADIVDIKEPTRGSLGMADSGTIESVADAVGTRGASAAVSAAFGEATEWLQREGVGAGWDAGRAGIPSRRETGRLTFAKLGLAGIAGTSWSDQWGEARQLVEQRYRPLQWIAVAYVDWHQAKAPPPEAVIEEAANSAHAGILLDTATKDGRSLPDWLSPGALHRLIEQGHRRGLLVALAGRLTRESLPHLTGGSPEVIGIRTAACGNGSRTGRVSVDAVRRFKMAMSSTWT